MQRNILWIFVVAAFGFNRNVTNGEKPYVCTLGPYDAPGRMYSPGWFYDKSIDKCVYHVFGDGEVDTGRFNRFSTEDDCNSMCRSHVPKYCFVEPGNSRGRASHHMWTYNAKSGSCNSFFWGGDDTTDKNVFKDKPTCEKMCREPDMGECGKSVPLCKREDNAFFRFNDTTQKCYFDNKNECRESENAFQSVKACYRRCGRFVTNKCELPIQNISICATLETRYGYNNDKAVCEKILGCDDGGNSFATAKECWTTCAKDSGSRCVMKPDKGKLGWIGKTRWYYDITENECKTTKQTSVWKGTGKTNLFASKQDCEEHCKPVH